MILGHQLHCLHMISSVSFYRLNSQNSMKNDSDKEGKNEKSSHILINYALKPLLIAHLHAEDNK